MIPFEPAPWARGGDAQTLIGYFLPAPRRIPGERRHEVPLGDGDSLLLLENRRPRASGPAGAALMVHGLGGHARSPYLRRMARRFADAGWIALRANMRGAGDGTRLARRLYHSGRSADMGAAVEAVARMWPDIPVVVIGFSLGGSILLKHLGEAKGGVEPNVLGAISVCPPLDLGACADELARARNAIYDRAFALEMAIAARGKEGAPLGIALWHPMSIRDFDDRVTAPMGGFASGRDYYEECSARRFLAEVRVPATILAADDDPFVPVRTYRELSRSDFLEVLVTRGGGHMGYLSAARTPLGDRRWLDYFLLERAAELAGRSRP